MGGGCVAFSSLSLSSRSAAARDDALTHDTAALARSQGIFPHGIDVLRQVDFFTVSVRHRAFLQAAVAVASCVPSPSPLSFGSRCRPS